ncbi:MAG TPA: FMN-binding protein [Ideonella sp.]|uniref:FMN-binding protein n=1 Tax=Ideonella sp. TaxID=1929293 RepID=UPI002E366C25|nr:FMN-binding protein [Ideonella sp.]HEX5686013.1 FMN-binding protein [Ideonella sp.]
MIDSANTSGVTGDAPAETVSGWALGKRARRILLALHITLTCVWLGALAVTMLLVGAQQAHPVAAWRPGLDRAVLLVHDTLIVNASYGFILTGLLFSLFTTWGAFRLWWVSLKWILLAGLGLALPLWVAPHVSAMSALSDAMSGEVSGQAAYAAHAQAVMLASALQAAVLVGIVAISVFKPWGPRPALRQWPRAVALGIAALVVVAVGGNLWVQNVQLEGYRQPPVTAVDVGALRDGSYEGQDTQAGFVYRVRVRVAAGRIERVEVLSTRDSDYARLAALSIDKLAGRAHNDVDAISGATTTSKALLRAVSDALQHAPRREAPP